MHKVFNLTLALCALLMAVAFAGCATMNQEMETADGDRYSTKGSALFSKQDIQADSNFIAYPNNSGLEFQTGANAAQDSTAALAAMIQLGQILGPLMNQGGAVYQISPLQPRPPTLRETIEGVVAERIEEALRERLPK